MKAQFTTLRRIMSLRVANLCPKNQNLTLKVCRNRFTIPFYLMCPFDTNPFYFVSAKGYQDRRPTDSRLLAYKNNRILVYWFNVMPAIVAIANQKGGVGKTTTTICLAAALAKRGKQVLCVDVDPQAGLTIAMDIAEEELGCTIYDALNQPKKIAQAITSTNEGFDIAISSPDLAGKEVELATATKPHFRLATALKRVDYEFILIDCPPSLGLLAVNCLTAANFVLVPIACEYLALRGLALLIDTIGRIKADLNPGLRLLGILPTLYESRTLHAKEVLSALRERFGELVFKEPIKRTVRFREAPIVGQSILAYSPKSQGSSAYKELAKEVIKRV